MSPMRRWFWIAAYLLLFLVINLLSCQSVFNDGYAQAPLISVGQRGIVLADAMLIFRRWTDPMPLSAVPAHVEEKTKGTSLRKRQRGHHSLPLP